MNKIFKNLILVYLCLCIFIMKYDIIFGSHIIYDKPIAGPEIKKPEAIDYSEIENQIYYSDEDKIKEETRIYYDISLISTNSTIYPYTKVPHYLTVREVIEDYYWTEDVERPGKYKLFIEGLNAVHRNHFAKGGYYKLGEDIYCFDENGDMIVGLGIDCYNIIYNFGNDGKLINSYKQ